MGICSLHAQAEACRFVLLYMEYTENPGLSILIPIISGSAEDEKLNAHFCGFLTSDLLPQN